MASRFICTRLHLASGGSLIPAHLFHTSFNASVGLFPVLPQARGGNTTALAVAVGLLCLFAATSAFVIRRKG